MTDAANEDNIDALKEKLENLSSEAGDENEEKADVAEYPGLKSNGGTPVPKEDIEDLTALKKELEEIKVALPAWSPPPERYNPEDFPQSYRENLPKEEVALHYAERFRRQYVHLYRDRKPLFLNPLNELEVEKFVCTTLRPTQLPFEEVYDWNGAAEFVADYLNFVALEPAYELPSRLVSPTTTLKVQKGNCFDYANLLCSLLIGNGYDAYVVSGYATRETCLMDETRETCPVLKKKEEVKEEEKRRVMKKYSVKPPKDLRSKYELMMEKRRLNEEKQEQEKREQEEQARIAELEKPPPDPLHGMRIHAWVMILAGKREVPEGFFVEPLTGIAHPLNSAKYLGIESVWNHHNYWVNMQDCSDGLKSLQYDLGDSTKWEYMFRSNDKPQLQIPDGEDEFGYDDDEDNDEDIEKFFDVPPSWTLPITLSVREYQMRCPMGKKVKLYKKAKLEKFAEYHEDVLDGLVSRLSIYADNELTDLTQVKEFFAHRVDQLQQRAHNKRTGWVTEHFRAGRQRHLKEHLYKASAPGPENERVMVFWNEARVDGLMKREEHATEMTEHFKDRDDFLYFRQVTFGKRVRTFRPKDDTTQTPRPILKIVERFRRNERLPANEDVAERVFILSDEKIQLRYHTEGSKVSASTREFIKPANADEKGATLVMSSDMHVSFQVDPHSRQKKQVEIYQMLLALLKAEEESKAKVRESEEEVEAILEDRRKEDASPELEISVYDTERNIKAKNHRKELERQQMEEKLRRQEMELDYLAPFLAQIGDPEKINKPQAVKLKEDCLADLKDRLVNKANLIQARFETETQELQKKQQWYQQNQISMSKDDEEDYLNYCQEAMFRIHILELRLNRHKESAPAKYMELEQKIRADPRLSEYF